MSYVLTVVLEDRFLTFTRAVGLLRRRRFPVHSLELGPADAPGFSRLTLLLPVDAAAAERAVQHLRKVVGVREIVASPVPSTTDHYETELR